MNETGNRGVRTVFLGSPLIDLTCRIDAGAILSKYNLHEDTAYVADETNKGIFDIITNKNASITVGGSVTNTVRTFRKLCDSPQDIAYLGSIGKDRHGLLIQQKLDAEGIGSCLAMVDGESTGKVAVLLRGKARTLVTDLGASRTFPLNQTLTNKLSDANLVYFSAFFVGVSFPVLKMAVEGAEKTVAFNLGASFLPGKYPEEVTYLYRKSQLVFGNEAEYRAFAMVHNIDSSDLHTLVMQTDQLQGSNGSRVVVVTRGGDQPVLVVHRNRCEEFEVRSAADKMVVNSNGAGDVFVGAFLARYVGGYSVANCVRCGVRAAYDFLSQH